MSNKGIIIDVGFAADIKDFINEIESQFKNVDFSNMIGLSEAFDDQVKGVRKQLDNLKKEIDSTLNGTVKNDPSKQIQNLNKAVGVLTSSFKEMAKAMLPSQASKLTAGLDSIISEMNELSGVCDNTVNAIEGVKKVADGDIQFVNTDKLKELEQLYKIFINLEKQAEKTGIVRKKSGNIPYQDSDEVLRDIIATYEKYNDVMKQMWNVEDDSSLSSSEKTKELDKLNNEYIQMSINLQRLIETYEVFKGNLDEKIKVDGGKSSISSIREELAEEFDSLLSYISKRKSDIQSEVYSLGGGNLDALIDDTNKALKSNKLTVPISISKKESTLLKDALAIIAGVQSKIDGNPLEVQVAFVSKHKSKRNTELLDQISNNLNNIPDGEVKNKLSNLVDNLNKQLGDDLLIKVRVDGSENASKIVKELIQNLQHQIDEADFTVYPEIKMTDEVKKKLQDEINDLSKIATVNIGFKDEAGEATGASSVKKEIKNISDLREELEKVITAIDNKTVAFQIEEQTVSGVVRREISSLEELLGWINIVENNVKELSERFESMTSTFKIDFAFNDGTVESINELIDGNTLSKLTNLKQLISSSFSSGSGDLIEIPEVQKKKLLKDVQKLSNQINDIFETKSIDKWSSKFISSLTEVSNKIKTLFGDNALSDMIEEWNYSDEIMKSRYGNDHLRERAAIIDDKGNIYGSGTYDQHGSTRFSYDIMDELKSRNIIPKIGIHSHSSDRVVAQSISQKNPITGNIDSGDIGAFLRQYVSQGLEKQITIALNDIAVFDSKGFYDSNKSIDFTSERIKNLIMNKSIELRSEMNKFFNQYFENFVSEYGVIDDGSKLKNEIMSSIRSGGFTSPKNKIKKNINDLLDPQDLLNEFFNLTNNTKQGLGQSLTQAIVSSLKKKNFSYQDLGLKKDFGDTILKEILNDITSNVEKILGNAFNISDYDFYLSKNKVDENGNIKVPRDLSTYNFRQITPRILEEALSGEDYKNNYQDFMKVYSKEDFIKQNPLGLSSGNLSDLFDNSAPTTFLETLDKIVVSLQEIKDISSSDAISNAFNIKIDESSLKTFIEEINRLIESLEKIPSVLSNSFDGLNTAKSDNIINSVGKKLQGSSNVNGINDKTNAFKTEGTTVDSVVNGEIQKLGELENKLGQVTQAVNAKTNAFKEEGKVVKEVTDGEVQSLDPLKNLESSFNSFKKFYDNNDLESEAGAQAALSYYNAYKEALASKVNKKDLQPFTLGKMDDLFTGNYANYKKGVGELDLSGLNSQITKYQEIIDKFNQPEVVSIINALTEAIEKLLAAGNGSAEAATLLKNLNNVINNLGGKNSAEKIAKIATNLENFQKSIHALDISDSGFINSINSILEKGEELKVLGEVLKSTQKQINAAGKAVKEEENLNKAQEYLEKYENDIREAVNQKHASKGETVLYQQLQATKDGLVQVIALIKDAKDEYKRFVYTTTDGSSLKTNTTSDNQAALAKQIKQWETYEKLKKLAVQGATNLGEEGVTFTPESDNWDQLVDKAKQFGIEVGNIQKIMRTVDEVGQESFQIFTKLSRVTVGMNSNGVLFQKDEVLDASKAIKDFEKDVDNLKKSLSNSFKDDMGTDKFLKTIDEISETWKELNFLNEKGLISDEALSKSASYFEAFKASIASFSLDKISTDRKTPEFIEQLKQAENQLDLVKAALDKVQTGTAFTDEDKNNVKEFISLIRELNNASSESSNKLADFGQTSKLLGKIADVLDTNTAMSKGLRKEFEQLSAEIQSFGNNLPYDKFKEFSNRFESLKTTMKQTGQTGLSFFDGIIKRAKSMSQSFISMYLSLWDIVRYVRTGVTYIKELDTALTEMRKVSDESTESLKRFQNASFDIASAVGTTAKQIQNSTADWMRLGESLNEASESARVSNILLNVSEFGSIDEATESLVSMSAAYDELDKIDIVDKLNQVGNNFSISTDGLATALQRSASALTTAGNDMDEAVALVTAGNAVVQDPDSVGAGLRTIALRITGTEAAKAELEELGEDTSDFVVKTSAKSQQAIKDFTRVASNNFQGFDILDDNGNFKSTYDILLGISEIYDEIVETDKQYGSNMANGLLETLAGKNRANIAASILQNPELLKDVYTSSQGAEGSAEKELDKYLDSIEGKISKFTNEVQEFWYNLISSDTIKTIVDVGTTFVDILGDIVGHLGEIGTLATVAGVAFGASKIKNSGGRVKKFALVIKYATESFSREVCEFWCTLEW